MFNLTSPPALSSIVGRVLDALTSDVEDRDAETSTDWIVLKCALEVDAGVGQEHVAFRLLSDAVSVTADTVAWYDGGERVCTSVGQHGRWWLLDAVLRLVMREVGLARVASSLVVCDKCVASSDVDGRCGVDVSSFSVNANLLARSGGNKLVPLCRKLHTVRPRDVVLTSELLSDWSVGTVVQVREVNFSVVGLVVVYHGVEQSVHVRQFRGGVDSTIVQQLESDHAMGVALADICRELTASVQVLA